MRGSLSLFAAALVAAAPVWAAPLFETEAARAALADEIRAVLAADPDILENALSPAAPSSADLYRDARDSDLALIAAEAPHLFGPDWPLIGAEGGPVAMAVFTGSECAECPGALAELEALLGDLGRTATRIDADTSEGRALMERLTLDALPSYVLPKMMVRGQVPGIVLQRYLAD